MAHPPLKKEYLFAFFSFKSLKWSDTLDYDYLTKKPFLEHPVL